MAFNSCLKQLCLRYIEDTVVFRIYLDTVVFEKHLRYSGVYVSFKIVVFKIHLKQ